MAVWENSACTVFGVIQTETINEAHRFCLFAGYSMPSMRADANLFQATWQPFDFADGMRGDLMRHYGG